MANPYDFSSGYLKAKEQKDTKAYRDEYMRQQKEELGLKKPYWEAQAREADARGNLYGEQAADARLKRGITVGRAKTLQKRGMLGDDFDLSAWVGDTIYGVDVTEMPKADLDFKPEYGLAPKVEAGDDMGAGLQFRRFTDGTPGGVGQAAQDQDADPIGELIQNRGLAGPVAGTTINNQSPADQSSADPAATASAPKGPFKALADQNPGVAKKIFDDTYKKTSNFKNLSNTLLELQSFDYIEGKVTTKGMLENVQALKKMQQEGFFSAVNEAISGDPNKALELYREFGDDKAENVKSMTTFDISEDVPNSKVKDKRKGVLITYQDGTTMKVDPRKLIMDAVTIKEFLDYEKGVKKDLREGEDKDLDRSQTERLRNDALNDKRDQQKQRLEESVRGRLMNEFKSEFSRMYKTYLDPNSPNFIPDENAKQRKGDEIDAGLRPAQNIAMGNVALGNYNVDASLAIQAAGQASNPQFLSDPNNFELGPNGKPVTKEAYGQLYARTRAGVWIPVGLAK